MRMSVFPTIALLLICTLTSFAQIESVRVETYYISNAYDATDTIGGRLEEGSTTYRIYVALWPGSRIHAIYGDENHPLIFSSTEPFFNHKEEGITFGKDLNRNRYEIGTVPLDTYITLGQCSRPFAQGAYFGVPKNYDADGSIVGGLNNDGGSSGISAGLLANDTTQIGIPLTVADGLVLGHELPDSWLDIGFKDVITDTDTTIFGLKSTKVRFSSTSAILRNSGIMADSEQNEILIAQLTTKGEISFDINLEIEIFKDGILQIVKYVAQNEVLGQNEVFNPLLKFPYECGCTDPNYLEANTSFACSDSLQCKTPIILGCMDSLACNFDPKANFNIPELCCYIGYCHDLDIQIVCPDLQPRYGIDEDQIKLYPNPAISLLTVELEFVKANDIKYTIYDIYNKSLSRGVIGGEEKDINISQLTSGYYFLQLDIDTRVITLPFVKI